MDVADPVFSCHNWIRDTHDRSRLWASGDLTACLMTMVMIIVWKQQIITAVAFLVVLGSIELLYLSATFFKVPEGGWIPVLLSLTFVFVWNYGKLKKHKFDLENKVSNTIVRSVFPELSSFTRIW